MKFRGEPFKVDITPSHLTADKLEDSIVKCPVDEKDFYLCVTSNTSKNTPVNIKYIKIIACLCRYYFLLKNPGKTLVFVNAISCLKRLVGLFAEFKLPVCFYTCVFNTGVYDFLDFWITCEYAAETEVKTT